VAESTKERLSALEADLHLPPGFIMRLLDEDDWSFVIKLHALFEAALTHALIHKLGATALRDVLAETELSNPSTGKVAFARALELLDKKERRFITSLSQLRNKLVHNIENVRFTLPDHLRGLDSNQREAFVESFSFSHEEKFRIAGHEVTRHKFTADNPKIVIWQTGIWLLARLQLEKEIAQLTNEAARTLMDAVKGRVAI
jgi:hypothetical protein